MDVWKYLVRSFNIGQWGFLESFYEVREVCYCLDCHVDDEKSYRLIWIARDRPTYTMDKEHPRLRIIGLLIDCSNKV